MDKLANPLHSLIAQAAKLSETGEAERFRERFEQSTAEVVILADVSSSMSESAGAKTKIEMLRDALSSVLAELPTTRLIAFNSLAKEISNATRLPEPSGGTALNLALDAAQPYRPRKTVVISDGQPDDEDQAFAAADRITGVIDVIYCGPDGDAEAIAFMNRLARRTGGTVVRTDWKQGSLALAPAVKRLLLSDGRV